MKNVTIKQSLEELTNGRLLILTDDSPGGRRGCFIMPAEDSTAEKINQMSFYGRGLISLAMPREKFYQLGLPLQEEKSGVHISFDAAENIGAGISANDRNTTIKTACHPKAEPRDIKQPGHIFPVEAEDGGSLVRPLFADAAIDLVRLAGLGNCAVVCDILDSTGEFAGAETLNKLAEELNIKLCSIHDIVEYRFLREPLVERLNTVNLPTDYGDFRLHVYKARFDSSRGIDLALTCGKETFDADDIPLVRVHSEWSIANIVNRLSFEEGSYLNRAMKKLADSKEPGVIVFLRNTPEMHTNSLFKHEEKPTDIWIEKGRLTTLSPMGRSMSYGFGAQILRDLGVRKMKILSNKGKSFQGIDKYGLKIVEQIPF